MDRDHDVNDNRCRWCDEPLIVAPSGIVDGKGAGKGSRRPRGKGSPPHESDVETLYYVSD